MTRELWVNSQAEAGERLDLIKENYARGKQTFIIPLTFPDLSAAVEKITHISYGGDVWELRVDLLSHTTPLKETNLPSTAYVKQQLNLLQSWSSLPILFTIRTKSQGGKFPNDAHHQALELMLLAIEEGCAYIDVEIEWPQTVIDEILKQKKTSQIVASFHDWTGNIRWTGQTIKEKYKVTDQFGGKK
jgi:3-dehydroquinate dehydratase type I